MTVQVCRNAVLSEATGEWRENRGERARLDKKRVSLQPRPALCRNKSGCLEFVRTCSHDLDGRNPDIQLQSVVTRDRTRHFMEPTRGHDGLRSYGEVSSLLEAFGAELTIMCACVVAHGAAA